MGSKPSAMEPEGRKMGLETGAASSEGVPGAQDFGLASTLEEDAGKESHAMNAYLCSVGTASPRYSISQENAARVAQSLRLSERWLHALPQLYRKSGVKRRGSVLLTGDPETETQFQTFFQEASPAFPRGPTTHTRMLAYAEHAGPLLHSACATAIEGTDWKPERITHLVTVSCTGFASPGIDHHLMHTLGLRRHVLRTHVGFMGCHGMINGLRTAHAIAASHPEAVVLVGAVELCSLHQQYTDDPQQLVANGLFADGAASAVVAGSTACEELDQPVWRIVDSHAVMMENSRDQMAWLIGDHGFQMVLSPEVPALIERTLSGEVDAWLQSHRLDRDDIDVWAIHPGGPRILDAVETSLGLDADWIQTSRDVLADHGNMSSPTVLFILQRLEREREDAKRCVMMAFGPGIHAEMLLLERCLPV